MRGPEPDILFPFEASDALWGLDLQAFNLQTNMRQRGDDTWVRDLNALRTCCVRSEVDEALERLRPRQALSTAPSNVADAHLPDVRQAPWRDAVHVFPRTHDAQAHNERRLGELQSSGAVMRTFAATHAELLHNGAVSNRPVARAALPQSADECGGLEAHVSLAVGARVMLRRNLDTTDSLVNGAMGTVEGFEISGGAGNVAVVQSVFVLFDNPAVGRLWREMRSATGQHARVGITRTTAAFMTSSGRMLQRTQFALSLAWGVTVHKTQGLTMDRAVLDVGDTLFAAGQAYVALSRVRTREGVALLALASRERICLINQRVLRYYQRLGFVPQVCDSQQDEEGERQRESARVRERERARRGEHEADEEAGGQEGEQREQQHEQQQRRRGRSRSRGRETAGERAGRDIAHLATTAQLAVGARGAQRRARGVRGRGGRGQRSTRGRGRGRVSGASDAVARGAAGALIHMGEALRNPGLPPPRPQPVPLRLGPLPSAESIHVRAAQSGAPARSWPPDPYSLTCVSGGRRVPCTFSWLFVPLIGHALGMGHLFPNLPAQEPQFAGWVQALQAAFQQHNITWAGLQQSGQVIGGNYVPANVQEHLIDMAGMMVSQQIQLYGVSQANAAILQLQEQNVAPHGSSDPGRRVRPRHESGDEGECSGMSGTVNVHARAGPSNPP